MVDLSLGKCFTEYMTRKMRGLAQIPLIIGLVIMAIAVPVATRLVEQNQDTRRSAVGDGGNVSLPGIELPASCGGRCDSSCEDNEAEVPNTNCAVYPVDNK